MEQFNLEKYLENPNREVVTRSGNPVRILCTDCGVMMSHPILTEIVCGRNAKVLEYHYIDGTTQNKNNDLFFADDEENLSEDEKIRKSLIEYFGSYHSGSAITNDVVVEDVLAWLEKQAEQKLCMIQWKGDNLKEVISFTGKNKNFDKWFTSFEEYERYVHEHNNIFKLFNEDGSHYEVPVGAWIVKTPDGYNVASKAVLKQNPADKVEPKFKVGDWITNGDRIEQISEIDNYYRCFNGNHGYGVYVMDIESTDAAFHIWTIQDAKDGDVVVDKSDGTIGIFQSIGHHPDGGSYNDPSYCFLHCRYDDGFFYADFENGNTMDSYDAIPSTKEQCDILFAKMKEEGYEWDAEKKELNKINSACSKEDEKMIEACLLFVNANRTHPLATKCIDWLTSIKDRVQPQPKQELSKEDSERLLRIHQFIWANRKGDTDEIYQQEQDADWLMSIIPQPNQYDKGYEDGYSAAKYNQWKPTDKQMEDFRMLLDYNIGVFDYAKFMSADSLYEDLKKNLID